MFRTSVRARKQTLAHAEYITDILREQLDGTVGMTAKSAALHGRDCAFWEARRATIERAAKAADPAGVSSQPR
jgi:hypothetical protein